MTALQTFLQTGELGGVHVGLSRSEVLVRLGACSDSSVPQRRRRVGILRWGDLEVAFDDDDRVIYVALMVWAGRKGTAVVITTPAVRVEGVTRRMRIDEFATLLDFAPEHRTSDAWTFPAATAYFSDDGLEKIIAAKHR